MFVVIYTAAGGTKAVSITQRWQMTVIWSGMLIAFGMILHGLPADISFLDATSIAGKMGKLNAVDFSFDLTQRYNFWSGLLGGFFLSLSYFGTDQSQVQRYLAGGSRRRQPLRPDLQRRPEDPDAILHPLHRRDGVCLFPIREAADVLQSAGV